MSLFPRYKNKEIKVTKNSSEELWRYRKDLWDVLKILEKGYPCPKCKRKGNVIEKCWQKGDKVYKAVVVELEDYCLLTHFGMFTYKRW